MKEEIEVTRTPPFPSRQLVIAAANILKAEGHSGFEALRLEFGLDHTEAGKGSGLQERANTLAKYALEDPERRTPEGISLQSAIVARAGEHYRSGTRNNIGDKERNAFKTASSTAGSLNDVTESGSDRVQLPYDDGIVSEFRQSWAWGRPAAPPAPAKRPRGRKVFIVHGHDEVVRLEVSRFLERLDFEAVVLHEQVNRGGTIIEKFEANSDAGFVVVLLTPDDAGGKTGGPSTARARQNVILEWGFFIGKLGRERVTAFKRGEIELPSDIHGLVWETFDGAWRLKLAKELKAAGFEIDWEKVAT